MCKRLLSQLLLPSCVLLAQVMATPLLAQSSSSTLAAQYPELSGYFNAFDVSQAAMYDRLQQISESPEAMHPRMQLSQTLQMKAEAEASTSHNMHMANSDMSMSSPFADLARPAMDELYQMVQAPHSESAAQLAFANSSALTSKATNVLNHGREFETQLLDILANLSLVDKSAAIEQLTQQYLDSGELAVPASPKRTSLLHGQPYGSAFRTAYPQLSGLNWTTQWLQLASFEALMLLNSDDDYSDTIATTVERFESKLQGMRGIMVSKIPTEMPMTPAIAPLLYNRYPETAIIIDNLNMLEGVI
ncbi:MAG: hypothetical protein COC19_00110, partial [SAR86 cluster bacterium]